MLDKQQSTDRTKGEEHEADQPSGKPSDPILKKLKYPKTSGYRVKYEEDELVVEPDEA
jgi:hypothetical protein